MNKVVLITGASRGIGRNIAYNLACDGYSVIANYNKSENDANSLKEELESKNINISLYKADVSNKEEVEGLVRYSIEKYGKIDILINNAGITKQKLFTDFSDAEFDEIMKVNLYSAFYVTREALKDMIKRHSGLIINISSIYGISGGSCEVPYSMAKAGIIGMTKALAKEVGPSNIRVNSIAPGAIDTDMNNNLTASDWQAIVEETPLEKKGTPLDITRCVKWLIEDEFTTGQVISPNGGLVI